MLELFTSTYVNKIDKKGRVSVPPPYRSMAIAQGFSGIIVFPSLDFSAIDGAGKDYFQRLSDAVDELPPFSEEREAFATAIIGASHPLLFDSEGRVTLPENLLQAAGISDSVVFVGLGQYFRLWQPEAFALVNSQAIKTAHRHRSSLNWPRRNDSRNDKKDNRQEGGSC